MSKPNETIELRGLFEGVYKGKKVLVTGNTGFKGGWLTTWLLELGAQVLGYSIDIPTKPSYFEIVGLKKKIKNINGDVRDLKRLKNIFSNFRPDMVFHLAAQAITLRSYDIPHETFSTNIEGTVNVLECLRNSRSVKAAIIVTSDKCYYNSNWEWGYRENDKLGGNDPYSVSKACAEIVCHSYFNSFFSKSKSPKFSTVRAGNVIGGGDWAEDRIVPDCVRAWRQRKKPIIRHPNATRPWLHVLEPLSGYLWLGAQLLNNPKNINGEAFNFGPDSRVVKPVKKLVSALLKIWDAGEWQRVSSEPRKKEAAFLKLCSDKALNRIRWHSVLSFEESVKLTAEWYKRYYTLGNMYKFSCDQIRYYAQKARGQGLPWSRKAGTR